ncbi:MAG: hypothetical protein JNK09_07805 [Prolixibacteraceae bacterium]|nr:hypothetical protein [Prolixibacteraceae bacterium]
MSSLTDYNDLLANLQAMRPEKVSAPVLPIDVFVQEAENLFHWCADDQAQLVHAGLNWELVTSLPVRAGACREAQSRWIKERNVRQEAEQLWKDQSPAAFDLRDQLIHSFRYAFRKDEGLLSRVEEIAQGNTNSDMVQDLNDLAVLGLGNLDLLSTINFDGDLLNTATELADQMGDLLGAANGERKKDSEAMDIRDRAYTYLKEAVDEIRECGKFVFWRNPDRQKGYISDFWKAKNATKAKETPEV